MIFDGLAHLPDFVQPVGMTFAIVAILTFLNRDSFELNPLSWFIYSTTATMLVFSINVYRRIAEHGLFYSYLIQGIDWQPDFIWGPMALLFALLLCNWFLPGFSYWQFSDVSNMLAGQIGFYWLFPFAIGLMPWFGEFLGVLFFIFAPFLFLLALIRPRGNTIVIHSDPWGDDDDYWY